MNRDYSYGEVVPRIRFEAREIPVVVDHLRVVCAACHRPGDAEPVVIDGFITYAHASCPVDNSVLS